MVFYINQKFGGYDVYLWLKKKLNCGLIRINFGKILKFGLKDHHSDAISLYINTRP